MAQAPENNVNDSIVQHLESQSMSLEDAIRSIDLTLKGITAPDGMIISQSSMQDFLKQQEKSQNRNADTRSRRYSNDYRWNNGTANPQGFGFRSDTAFERRKRKQAVDNILDQGLDAFEDAFVESMMGSANPIRDALKKPIAEFANKLNTSVDDLGKEVGSRLGKIAYNAFSNTTVGRRLEKEWKSMGEFATNKFSSYLDSFADYLNSNAPKDAADNIRRQAASAYQSSEQYQNYRQAANSTRSFTQQAASTVENAQVRGMETFRNSVEGGFTSLSSFLKMQFASVISAIMSTKAGKGIKDVVDSIKDKVGFDPGKFANIFKKGGEGPGAATRAVSTMRDIAESDIIDVSATITDVATGAQEFVTAAKSARTAGTALATIGEQAGATGTQLVATGTQLATQSASTGLALAGAGEGAIAASTALPLLTVAIGATIVAFNLIESVFGEAIEGLKGFLGAVSDTSKRVKTQNAKNMELYQNRIKADIESMIEAPFTILKDAANSAIDTWNNVLRTVTATQGYNKEDLQDLWAGFADRLKAEGLDSTISSADIMSNLESVLKGGLSGKVAEEFAYLATKLNNAIPTEDFFQYAQTYASIAANAMKSGQSQAEAIETANAALNSFASNILYASREVAGGFSTKLTNAASLFEQSAKIALTSRADASGQLDTSVGEISGVLTSVAAIIGATAPDMADGIVSAVVEAATGGNAANLTALRSMAGVGASNTAFLNALSTDPQALFENLFRNLAQLQNMSSANYMEVAEGLSSIFGLSIDAFARVDFDYLADAIKNMEVNNESLDENLKGLRSGQTTSNAAQMRMQQINKYMIDEGLAYVLDNEVARSIQEHMWQEQLARQITDSEFAVTLQGKALEFLKGIDSVTNKISNFLHGNWFQGINSIKATVLQQAQLSADVISTVAAGRVGSGTYEEFTSLINGGRDLKLTESYLNLIQKNASSESAYEASKNLRVGLSGQELIVGYNGINLFGEDGELAKIMSATDEVGKKAAARSAANTKAGRTYSSIYDWSLVSKSSAASSGDWRDRSSYSAIFTEGQGVESVTEDKMNEFISSMKKYVDERTSATASIDQKVKNAIAANPLTASYQGVNISGRRYLTQDELAKQVRMSVSTESVQGANFEDFIKTAKDSGIDNLEASLSDFGLDLADLRNSFDSMVSEQATVDSHVRDMHEVQFWEDTQDFVDNFFRIEFFRQFLDMDWRQNWEVQWLTPIRDDLKEFLYQWKLYYIEHAAYTRDTNQAFEKAMAVGAEERGETGDAVLALAKALTQNDLTSLKDPVVQTNVLLAQILVITEAIMQQNNESSVVSIPNALSALGLGVASPQQA